MRITAEPSPAVASAKPASGPDTPDRRSRRKPRALALEVRDLRKAFATCAVTTVGGVPHLVTQGAKAVYGLDARDGRELWRVEERIPPRMLRLRTDKPLHEAGTLPELESLLR